MNNGLEGQDDVIRSIATKVAGYTNARDKSFSIDPITIIAIINCIIALCRLLYVCYPEKKMAKVLKNPRGIIRKFVMKREIKKSFPKKHRKSVYQAMLDVSVGLSEKEVNHLIQNA